MGLGPEARHLGCVDRVLCDRPGDQHQDWRWRRPAQPGYVPGHAAGRDGLVVDLAGFKLPANKMACMGGRVDRVFDILGGLSTYTTASRLRSSPTSGRGKRKKSL